MLDIFKICIFYRIFLRNKNRILCIHLPECCFHLFRPWIPFQRCHPMSKVHRRNLIGDLTIVIIVRQPLRHPNPPHNSSPTRPWAPHQHHQLQWYSIISLQLPHCHCRIPPRPWQSPIMVVFRLLQLQLPQRVL